MPGPRALLAAVLLGLLTFLVVRLLDGAASLAVGLGVLVALVMGQVESRRTTRR